MRILILLLCCPIWVMAQAPNWVWAKSYPLYINTKQQTHAVDAQGNVYVKGDFETATVELNGQTYLNTNPALSRTDNYIIKHNPQGEILWVKVFGGTGYDYVDTMVCDQNGELYITGSFNGDFQVDSQEVPNTNQTKSYFARFSSDGNLITFRVLDSVMEGNNSKIGPDGNLYISGNFRSAQYALDNWTVQHPNTTGSGFSYQSIFMRLTPDGICTWLYTPEVEVDQYGNYGYDIASSPNGDITIAGTFSNSSMYFDGLTLTKSAEFPYNQNYYIAQFNANGQFKWAYSGGSPYNNLTQATSVVADSQNNVYFAGFFTHSASFGSTQLASIYSSGYMAKIASSGQIQWVNMINGNSGSVIRSLHMDALDHLLISGSTAATSYQIGNSQVNAPTGGHMFVARLQPNGQTSWVRGSGVQNINALNSVICALPNEIYISSNMWDDPITFGNHTVTKPSGASLGRVVAKLYMAPLNTEDFELSLTTLYPNPAADRLFWTQNAFENHIIFNSLGQQVQSGTSRDNSVLVSDLPSGVYFIKNAETNQSAKFIKE